MNNYYKALNYAQKPDITTALNTLYPYKEQLHVKKLYGLLLFRYGDYKGAYDSLKYFEAYEQDAKQAALGFNAYKKEVWEFVLTKNINKAIDAHSRLSGQSVTEKNIEGCLYGLDNKVNVARKCFIEALLMDNGNKQAANLIQMIDSYYDSRKLEKTGVNFYGKIKNLLKSWI